MGYTLPWRLLAHGFVLGPVPFSVFTGSLERRVCPLVRFAEATNQEEMANNGKHF